jgi:hypothetical protein
MRDFQLSYPIFKEHIIASIADTKSKVATKLAC